LSPILGIIASQNYPRVTNSYESIATVTVGGGGAADVTFSSIPSTYQHLQIRMIGRSDRAAVRDAIKFKFNATSSTYALHEIIGDGSTATASQQTGSTNGVDLGLMSGASATSGVFGADVFDILDYASTNKNKTIRVLNGIDNNDTNGSIRFESGLWVDTSAVTSITLAPAFGTNFAQYSSFALYGCK
jgi:hypothetical protein